MHFSTASAALIFIAGLAAAAPLNARDSCRPNFQGSNVDIVTTQLSAQDPLFLTPSHSPSFDGDTVELVGAAGYPFQPQFNGSPKNDYIIKLGKVSDNNLLIEYTSGSVKVGTVGSTSSPSWTISCDTCASPSKPYAPGDEVAKGCWIADSDAGYQLEGVQWNFIAA